MIQHEITRNKASAMAAAQTENGAPPWHHKLSATEPDPQGRHPAQQSRDTKRSETGQRGTRENGSHRDVRDPPRRHPGRETRASRKLEERIDERFVRFEEKVDDRLAKSEEKIDERLVRFRGQGRHPPYCKTRTSSTARITEGQGGSGPASRRTSEPIWASESATSEPIWGNV